MSYTELGTPRKYSFRPTGLKKLVLWTRTSPSTETLGSRHLRKLLVGVVFVRLFVCFGPGLQIKTFFPFLKDPYKGLWRSKFFFSYRKNKTPWFYLNLLNLETPVGTSPSSYEEPEISLQKSPNKPTRSCNQYYITHHLSCISWFRVLWFKQYKRDDDESIDIKRLERT